MKQEFRSLPTFSESDNINVDRDSDILRNVQIAKHGKNKNGSYFDDKFLADLVKKGNEQSQGVKSRFGHPNMCASSLGTYVGRFKNFQLKEKRVFADLHIDPIAKKTEVEGKGIKMYDYIMDMATGNSDMFGNSIVIMGDEYDGEVEYDGKKKMETIKVLHSLLASDLVDDPAATDNLFANNEDLGVAVTQFLDQNEQVFEALESNPNILFDFFERYSEYYARKSKSNNKMSLFEKLKKRFESKKEFDIDLTLATGDIITVVTENESPQVGDAVQDADGRPVEDDEHVLQDGRTIVTEGGNITEIQEASGDGDGNDGNGEGDQDENSVQELTERFNTLENDLESSFDMIASRLEKFEKNIRTLNENVKSSYEKPGAENTNGTGKKQTFFERVEEKRKEKESKNQK